MQEYLGSTDGGIFFTVIYDGIKLNNKYTITIYFIYILTKYYS